MYYRLGLQLAMLAQQKQAQQSHQQVSASHASAVPCEQQQLASAQLNPPACQADGISALLTCHCVSPW
jgi:hypothetical protein